RSPTGRRRGCGGSSSAVFESGGPGVERRNVTTNGEARTSRGGSERGSRCRTLIDAAGRPSTARPLQFPSPRVDSDRFVDVAIPVRPVMATRDLLVLVRHVERFQVTIKGPIPF